MCTQQHVEAATLHPFWVAAHTEQACSALLGWSVEQSVGAVTLKSSSLYLEKTHTVFWQVPFSHHRRWCEDGDSSDDEAGQT